MGRERKDLKSMGFDRKERMIYLCKTGGAEYRVELKRGGRDLSIKLDDKRSHVFPLSSTRSGLVSIMIDNRPYNLNIEKEGDAYLITINGESVRVGVVNEIIKDSFPFLSKDMGGHEGILKSRMAGRVTSIDIISGERAESGRRLLIIEAMKMENEIRAPRGCLIKEVFVNNGDVVRPGDRLMEIE